MLVRAPSVDAPKKTGFCTLPFWRNAPLLKLPPRLSVTVMVKLLKFWGPT